MMERLITAPSALLARLLNKKSSEYNRAVASITVRALLKGYSIRNVVWLAKQIAHETAWGTSNSMEVDKNPWGMNCVSVRETTQTGCREAANGERLGQYSSIASSCADRLLWDSYWGYDADKRNPNYPQIVSERYHTSPSYAPKVSAVDIRPVRIAVFAAILTVPAELFILYKLFNFILSR